MRAEPSWKSGRCEVVVDHTAGSKILWWEFDGDALPTEPPPTWDGVAVALVCLAMRRGEDLHIAGELSAHQLAALEEYQDAWTLWRPDIFRKITISADSVVYAPPRSDGQGSFAFSGGVDASFQLLVHHRGILGYRSVKAARAVFVHGLDIPLAMADAYELAAANAARIAGTCDVPLTRVRTNWRDFCPDWEMCFGSGVASILHLFGADTTCGYMAADEPYHMEVLPWGSNSVTNHLLGGVFRLESTGFGYTRTRKCELLSTESEVLENVRVCWEDPTTGRNCGRCEKCVRTKLNFAACGLVSIPALGGICVKDVEKLKVGNRAQLAYLDDIVYHGGQLPPAILSALRRTRARNAWRLRIERATPVIREATPQRLRNMYRLARRTLRTCRA